MPGREFAGHYRQDSAAGMAAMAGIMKSISRKTTNTIGNFWNFLVLSCFTADGLHNARHSRHTCRCGNKLEEHDDEQLGEIRQSALTGIMLQVTVYHKTDAGIECLVGSLRAITVRIHRQPSLTDQQHHSPDKPERF